MSVCPTEAIRIKDGKAVIYENKCIDCGMCFKVCPVDAIEVEQDDFSNIFRYKHRVALYPSILTGQFSNKIHATEIASVLLDIGFSHAFEVEHGADFICEAIPKYQEEKSFLKPLISSFCPAIIRLIQVKFPSLTNHIVQLKPPLDVAAEFYRKKLENEGIPNSDIGIFYITPCAAKIAAIKSPVGQRYSSINGVINMDFIYNRIFRTIKQGRESHSPLPDPPQLSHKAVKWSLTNGEASNAKGRTMAIDGVHNAIEFLEQLENGEISGIDYIEIRACDESCAGGILNTTNRFLITERLNQRAERLKKRSEEEYFNNPILAHRSWVENQTRIAAVKPRSMLKMDEDMTRALVKMEKSRRLMCFLPGIDCGACGAPNCQALADDIVQSKATLSDCIFMQSQMQVHGKMSKDKAYKKIEEVWGKERLQKDCRKKGAKDDSDI